MSDVEVAIQQLPTIWSFSTLQPTPPHRSCHIQTCRRPARADTAYKLEQKKIPTVASSSCAHTFVIIAYSCGRHPQSLALFSWTAVPRLLCFTCSLCARQPQVVAFIIYKYASGIGHGKKTSPHSLSLDLLRSGSWLFMIFWFLACVDFCVYLVFVVGIFVAM